MKRIFFVVGIIAVQVLFSACGMTNTVANDPGSITEAVNPGVVSATPRPESVFAKPAVTDEAYETLLATVESSGSGAYCSTEEGYLVAVSKDAEVLRLVHTAEQADISDFTGMKHSVYVVNYADNKLITSLEYLIGDSIQSDGTLEFLDFNADGNLDIRVLANRSVHADSFYINFVWNEATGAYESVSKLDELPSPELDRGGYVTSYTVTLAYSKFELYQFVGNEIVFVAAAEYQFDQTAQKWIETITINDNGKNLVFEKQTTEDEYTEDREAVYQNLLKELAIYESYEALLATVQNSGRGAYCSTEEGYLVAASKDAEILRFVHTAEQADIGDYMGMKHSVTVVRYADNKQLDSFEYMLGNYMQSEGALEFLDLNADGNLDIRVLTNRNVYADTYYTNFLWNAETGTYESISKLDELPSPGFERSGYVSSYTASLTYSKFGLYQFVGNEIVLVTSAEYQLVDATEMIWSEKIHFNFDGEEYTVVNRITGEKYEEFDGVRENLHQHLSEELNRSIDEMPRSTQMYKHILLGKSEFLVGYEESKSSLEGIKQFVHVEDWVTKFAIVDLDGNGEDEIVLWIQDNGPTIYEYEVLYAQDQEVYGFSLLCRDVLQNLKTDGTFEYTGDKADWSFAYSEDIGKGVMRLQFSERGYRIEDVIENKSQGQKLDVEWHDLTAENVESAFEAMSSEMKESYREILLGAGEFYVTRWVRELRLADIKQLVTSAEGVTAEVTKFTIVDLDGDGENEVVLWIQTNGQTDYGFEVLHYQDGNVYGFTRVYRGLMDLKTDGTFAYSGGAGNSGVMRLHFTEKGCTTNRLYQEIQSRKTDVEWYDLTPENIALAFGKDN